MGYRYHGDQFSSPFKYQIAKGVFSGYEIDGGDDKKGMTFFDERVKDVLDNSSKKNNEAEKTKTKVVLTTSDTNKETIEKLRKEIQRRYKNAEVSVSSSKD